MPWWTEWTSLRSATGGVTLGLSTRANPTRSVVPAAASIRCGASARMRLPDPRGGLLVRLGLEAQRRAVHAVAQAGRLRAVFEHMAKMRIAGRAADLGAPHEPR